MKLFNRNKDRPRGHRRGTCRRCGWTDDLVKVPRRPRRPTETVTTPRWVCTECADDVRTTGNATRDGAVGTTVGRPRNDDRPSQVA